MKFILLLIVMSQFSFATFIGPQDVSILLPLPQNQIERDRYLSASDVLGDEIYKKMSLDFEELHPVLFFENSIDSLAVMAIRLDPDFKDIKDDKGSPQIRLTLQSLYQASDQTFVAQDAAIHVFYELSGMNEFKTVMENLLKLKNENSRETKLDVNQNFNDALFQEKFQKEILSALASSKIIRVAVMSADPMNTLWFFKAYDVIIKNDRRMILERSIKGVDDVIQTVEILPTEQPDSEFPTEFLSSQENPSKEEFKGVMSYIKDSVSYKKQNKNLEPLLTKVDELLESSVFLPNEADCLSCHVAPSLNSTIRNERNSFSYTVTELIHFGYIQKDKKISKRVENETLEVVKKVRRIMK